jgi:hypothetical protein
LSLAVDAIKTSSSSSTVKGCPVETNRSLEGVTGLDGDLNGDGPDSEIPGVLFGPMANG